MKINAIKSRLWTDKYERKLKKKDKEKNTRTVKIDA